MVSTTAQGENSLDYHAQFVNVHYREIAAFFQGCIDQNLILNLSDNSQEAGQPDITTYYSTTIENAQAFEQKFQDLTAEFSMRKFWNQSGFETTMTMKEIDFDSVENPTDPDARIKVPVINDDHTEIWSIPFPYTP